MPQDISGKSSTHGKFTELIRVHGKFKVNLGIR